MTISALSIETSEGNGCIAVDGQSGDRFHSVSLMMYDVRLILGPVTHSNTAWRTGINRESDLNGELIQFQNHLDNYVK